MVLLHPWFLLGLFALVVPVVLHLFELRRPQRILFTNVDFIREVKLVTAKQQRLQHLLVLVLRLVFLALLVLLFCQPFIPADKQNSAVQGTVNLVLDTSPSMGVETPTGKPVLDRGVEEVEHLAAALPGALRYRLLDGQRHHANLSEQMLKEALATVEVNDARNGAGKEVQQLAQQLGSGAGRTTVVVSDFQRSDFTKQVLNAFGKTGETFLIPVATKPTPNVYVDSAYLTDEFVRMGVDLPLQIRLRNGGDEAATVQVRVLLGEQQVSSFEVELAAGAAASQTVKMRLTSNATQQGRIEVQDQPVRFDNTYYFTLMPAGRINVTDVATGPTATQRLYPNETTFGYAKVTAGGLGAATLAGTDVVLVQGDARLGETSRGAVGDFVKRGGALVVVPPAEAAARPSYDALFSELGLTAVRWSTSQALGALELAAPNRQSPFFRDVFVAQSQQGDMPKATPLLTWSRSTTDVLLFRDGQPFLSGFRVGEGMVYVFASPWARPWATFTEHPLFVPVMYRLATLSKRSGQLPAYRLTDRSIVLRETGVRARPESTYQLRNDSSAFAVAHQLRNGLLYLQLPPDMRTPGFYQLTAGGEAVTTLAFDVDRRESELARYSAEELRELTARYPNVHVYEASGGRSAAAQFAEERAGTPLWRYCLAGALLCLLGEVLVLRFGQRKVADVAQAA